VSEPPRTDWNAAVYDRIGTPMRGWAQQVIDDLELRGDETVLDAGCGSGSVTLDLLRKLPDGKVYAVDASPEMTTNLKKELAGPRCPSRSTLSSRTPSSTGFPTTTGSSARSRGRRSRAGGFGRSVVAAATSDG